MINVAFSKLNNDKLYTLSMRVHEILSPVPVADLGVELYFQKYVVEYEKYKEAILRLNNGLKIVSEKDAVRDKYGITFRVHVKNYTHHPDANIAEQAEKLLAEIDRNGQQYYKKSYKDQTAILEYIFSVVEKQFSDFIVTIHADVWYKLLKESQTDFENTLRELSLKKAETIDYESASTIRPELVNAMRNLFTFMPLHFNISKNEQLGKLIYQLQAEVKRF